MKFKALLKYDKRNSINHLIKFIDELEHENRKLKLANDNEKFEDTFPLTNIREQLISANKYIVLPKSALDINFELDTFLKSDSKYLSFNEISSIVGSLLNPITKIDERFKIVRWLFSIDEEKKFIYLLENKGYENITENIEKTDFDNLTGNEFFIVSSKELDILRNLSTEYDTLFNDF